MCIQDKLEQFLSIASNADLANKGDFSALKSAQDRSDLIKTYTGKIYINRWACSATVSMLYFNVSSYIFIGECICIYERPYLSCISIYIFLLYYLY